MLFAFCTCILKSELNYFTFCLTFFKQSVVFTVFSIINKQLPGMLTVPTPAAIEQPQLIKNSIVLHVL